MASRIKVLFIHGMESGPNGRKTQMIRNAGFDVCAVGMPCRRRDFFMDAAIVWALSLVLGVMLALPWYVVAGGPLCLVLAMAPFIVRRRFRMAKEIQTTAIGVYAPDIIVGSSFGGAVAVDLIVGGVWKGPALLLAPAHALLGRYMRVNAPVLPTGTKVTIVHGTNDKVVPLDDSRALQGRLIECDDDHHLRKFLTKATLTRLIEDLAKDT